jgi:hypothetical protein
MSLAFSGSASLALFAAARQGIHTRSGRFGTWGLLIIGVAYFCAGIFPLIQNGSEMLEDFPEQAGD